MKKIAIVSVLLLLAACSSTPKIDSSPVSQPSKTNISPAISQTAEKNTSVSSAVSSADIEARRLADEASKLESEMRELQRQSIYFDFDKSEIKADAKAILEKKAAWLLIPYLLTRLF